MPNQNKITEYTAVSLKINCKTCMHILLHSFHNNMSITVRIKFGLWKYPYPIPYTVNVNSQKMLLLSPQQQWANFCLYYSRIFFNHNFLLLFHFIHVCYNRAGPKALSSSIVLIWVAIGNMDHNRGCMCLGVSYRIRKPTR